MKIINFLVDHPVFFSFGTDVHSLNAVELLIVYSNML